MERLMATARACKTKRNWEQFFAKNGDQLAVALEPNQVDELAGLLMRDKQSLEYDSQIWCQLFDASLRIRDLVLGMKLVRATRSLPSSDIRIHAANVMLHSGRIAEARILATRTMKRSQLTPIQRLRLRMILCSAMLDSDQRKRCRRSLSLLEMEATRFQMDLTQSDQREVAMYQGRVNFSLGQYMMAAPFFCRAAELAEESSLWEMAAKAWFNLGVCLDNAGQAEYRGRACYFYVEKCRLLSERHQLEVTQAHCSAFYGFSDYWHGNFSRATDHYRRALSLLPVTDHSYRRSYLLTMMAHALFQLGRRREAQKWTEDALQMAKGHEGERQATSFENLAAIAYWEAGEYSRSQECLEKKIGYLLAERFSTIEDLQVLSRYIRQSALLRSVASPLSYSINDQLKANSPVWSDHCSANGWSALAQNDIEAARDFFSSAAEHARIASSLFHEQEAEKGLILTGLAANWPIKELELRLDDLTVKSAQLSEHCAKNEVGLLRAAFAYCQGDFIETVRILKTMQRQRALTSHTRIAVDVWLSSVEGHSYRWPNQEARQVVATYTRIFFRPRMRVLDDQKYLVGDRYLVDLSKHPALDELLRFLIYNPAHEASLEEIQLQVWGQSLEARGWKQKIRNSVMRLRSLFPYTLFPFFNQGDKVSLSADCVQVEMPFNHSSEETHSRIILLLREMPQSSQQLANRLNLSSATAKRALKLLSEKRIVTSTKVGRSVYYQASH